LRIGIHRTLREKRKILDDFLIRKMLEIMIDHA
jgi:hypothetical protein